MNIELMRAIRKKEVKTEAEEILLQYHKTIAYVSEILVEESKMHYSSEEAIDKIRNYLKKNL
ncbi:hypothetical protein CON36_34240 [Bacillus cereus]|uniref:Uncharacterized protein n=1 Tax=Bacillus cereus TaxID=1396 RepID=A0A9X6SSM8_BACCE|nr:hypothetical protein [Bacillus cereus]PDZ94357.1 hypothetical protein CON36_34240 [Bacillus cereus]PGP14634.1 hypothetical protein COA01_30235 [Bacillus cereus]